MTAWTLRDITVAEAAKLCGLHRKHLDMIVRRNRACEALFTEKRKGRRWFSARDVCVLRLAYECERAGDNWLTAIARAFEFLQAEPPPDAVLVFPATSTSSRSGRIISDRDVPRVQVAETVVLIPIGRICSDILERLEADLVAIR